MSAAAFEGVTTMRHERIIDPTLTQRMWRDFERLRRAIRSHDSFAAEAAWEDCEQWVSQLRPVLPGAAGAPA